MKTLPLAAMFHFLPLRRHIDASFKHTYTEREALP
jgi:hypothetical protein